MAEREVEVGQRVELGLLEYAGGLRAAALQHLYGQVVGRADGAGLPEAEHGRHDPGDAARRAPGAGGGPRAVAHEVDGAPLPGGALEGLLDRAPEALVGVGGHEPHAAHAPPLTLLRNADHESWLSVSTTPTPGTCLHPSESQPIAVAAAVDATRPERRHLA